MNLLRTVIFASLMMMVRADDCPVGQYHDDSGCQYCPVGQTTTDGSATSVGNCSTPGVEISLKFQCFDFDSDYDPNPPCYDDAYPNNFNFFICTGTCNHGTPNYVYSNIINKTRDFDGNTPEHGDMGNEIVFNIAPGTYTVQLVSGGGWFPDYSQYDYVFPRATGGWRDNRAVISVQGTEQAYSWRPHVSNTVTYNGIVYPGATEYYGYIYPGYYYSSRVDNDEETEKLGSWVTGGSIFSRDMELIVPSSECPKGQYGTSPNGCQTCPDGTTTEGAGALFDYDCVQCTPPQVISGRNCITICPAGYVLDGTTCQQCAVGTYRTSDMDECAANTDFKKGINEFRNDTVNCEAGYDSKRSGGATCQLCAEGTYRRSTMPECVSNTNSLFGINEFRTDTVVCALGQDSSRSVPAGATCQQCAEGTYRSSPVSLCEANTDFRKEINEFRNDTVVCALGYDSKRSGGATCQPCAVNTYRTSGMDECAANVYYNSTINEARDGLVNCEDGYDSKRSVPAGATCQPCAVDTYRLSGMDECAACPDSPSNIQCYGDDVILNEWQRRHGTCGSS